jgi:hypothetical protein
MQGVVFHNDEGTHKGIIVGMDRKQYGFTRQDWIGDEGKEDDAVEFKIEGNFAREVRVITSK